jgi:hypothetical protein
MNLETAIGDITYTELAAAFEKVTGHAAQYIDTDLEDYWNGPLSGVADLPAGYNADPNDKSTMSFRDNFTGFWNMWKARFITRDYALLDEIHPNRIKTAEEWFRREDALGKELGKGQSVGAVPTGKLESRGLSPQRQRRLEDGQAITQAPAQALP